MIDAKTIAVRRRHAAEEAKDWINDLIRVSEALVTRLKVQKMSLQAVVQAFDSTEENLEPYHHINWAVNDVQNAMRSFRLDLAGHHTVNLDRAFKKE